MKALDTVFFNLPAIAALCVAATIAAVGLGMSPTKGRRILIGLMFVALILHLAVFLSCALAYALFPWEGKSVVEGVVLYNASRYLHWEQPYRPPTELPFRSLVYPPGYEICLAPLLGLFGTTFPTARLFSLVCALFTAATAGLATWRLTRNRPASFFGGMLVVCCYGITGQWFEQARNDALMQFLCALGIFLCEGALRRGRIPVTAACVLLLATFTKQSAIFAPLAVVGFLAIRSRRWAAAWGAIFSVVAAGIFLAMELWSDGWFSFWTIRAPAGAGVEIQKLDLASTFFSGVWISLCAIVALLTLAWRDEAKEPSSCRQGSFLQLWAFAFMGAMVVCLLQSIKWGGALNAFIPVVPFMGVLSGVALDRFSRMSEAAGWTQLAVLSLAVMQAATISYEPVRPEPRDRQAQERIAAWVRAAKGDVFVSVFSSQVFLNGKKYYGDDVTAGDLERAGLWRGGELVEKTRRGEFALMILRPRIEPADLARAVRENYVPVERIEMGTPMTRWRYMEVYTPRRAPWHIESAR